jgi:flagellar basal-body rod modification protein FlgD
MTDNNIISTGLLSDLSIQNKTKDAPKSNELGQDAFLQLMITQMNNQNPLEPQSNSEFVAQLAQFSSVEGLDKLNNTMDGMASSFQSSQALQASSLVGRTVKVPSNYAQLSNGGFVAGTLELPYSTSDLKLNIYDDADQLVGQQLMGSQPGGDISFVWNGQSDDGTQLPAGRYRFAAVAMHDGQAEQLSTALSANVDSVTVGGNGTVTLNIAGLGPVSMSQVSEIL